MSFQESSFDDGGQASQVVSPESMRLIRHVTSYPSKEEVMQEFCWCFLSQRGCLPQAGRKLGKAVLHETGHPRALGLVESLLAAFRNFGGSLLGFPPTREFPPLQEFNAYIRGPLHLKLLSLLGSEVDVPLKLCVIGTAPSILLCLTLLLGCNGHHDCDTAAARLGYPSVTQYMLVNVLILDQPNSDGLFPKSDGLQPTTVGVHPNSDGLQPTRDGLQPNSDGLYIAMASNLLFLNMPLD